jgi:hypothetical protein
MPAIRRNSSELEQGSPAAVGGPVASDCAITVPKRHPKRFPHLHHVGGAGDLNYWKHSPKVQI